MMGYGDIMDSYRFVTENAAKVLHLGDRYGLRSGNPASFVVMEAGDYFEALSHNAPVVLSVRNGEVISRTKPAERQVIG